MSAAPTVGILPTSSARPAAKATASQAFFVECGNRRGGSINGIEHTGLRHSISPELLKWALRRIQVLMATRDLAGESILKQTKSRSGFDLNFRTNTSACHIDGSNDLRPVNVSRQNWEFEKEFQNHEKKAPAYSSVGIVAGPRVLA
jgi:hypothetical protein